jgi:hypothetical protein
LSLSIYFLAISIHAQSITADQLVNRTIAFHDPDGWWDRVKMDMVIEMKTPNRPARLSNVVVDNINGGFEISVLSNDKLLEWMVDGKDSCDFKVNFIAPTVAQADSLNLTVDRAKFLRNYYTYLYGLPMKLKDEGTRIGDEVIETTFMGKPVLALRVTYDESVGEDIWYFYFNPSTYAMVGYRFYHDEAKNDGEYIVLADMVIEQGLRIPRNRSWFTNAEDKLLGTDYLKEFKVDKGW